MDDELHTTLKPSAVLLLHATELPQHTELPATFVPQTTEAPQATDAPHATDEAGTLLFPLDRVTVPVEEL